MLRTSIFVSLILAGCTPPSTPFTGAKGSPMGMPTTASIGAAGGSLTAGALTITVPAGVFAQNTMVSATPLNATVPGKRGQPVRLEPEGMTFSQPVTITFKYDDAALEGTAPEALLIAYQHSSGMWAVPGDVTLDTTARTVSVQTTHFSDWSMVAGAQLRPPSASVKVNQTVKLVARRCFAQPESKIEMELAPLLIGYPCDADEELAPLPVTSSDWSVNGVAGGASSTGTIAGELSQGVFSAPGKRPSPARVAVSARVDLAKKGKVLVVSNVTVTDGSSTLLVRGSYSKMAQSLTAFVVGDVSDMGFTFEMPFPIADGEYTVSDSSGGGAANLRDTRSDCRGPTLEGPWDELRATRVTVTGSFVTIEGERSIPPITRGTGEGDCLAMSVTDPPRTETQTGLQFGFPVELFTSATPPAVPVSTTEAGWTLTYTTK